MFSKLANNLESKVNIYLKPKSWNKLFRVWKFTIDLENIRSGFRPTVWQLLSLLVLGCSTYSSTPPLRMLRRSCASCPCWPKYRMACGLAGSWSEPVSGGLASTWSLGWRPSSNIHSLAHLLWTTGPGKRPLQSDQAAPTLTSSSVLFSALCKLWPDVFEFSFFSHSLLRKVN